MVSVFALSYLKQFVNKADTHHKNLTITLNKKHAFREVLSLKIPLITENVEHLQTERVRRTKELSTNLKRRNFVLDLW